MSGTVLHTAAPAITTPSSAAPATAIPAQTPMDWLGIAMIVWLAGTVMFLAWHVAVYLHTKQKLLRGAAVIDSALWQKLCTEYGLQPRLLKSPAAQTPMAFGLLRPIIVLPAREFSGVELECILRHELCHLKARHLPMKFLLLAANALHWYNPAAWLLRHDAAAAMEQCCDEMALRGASDEQRGAYSRALLTCAGRQRFAPALISNWNGGTKEMKARLRNIFTAKPKRTILISAIVLLCAALAVTAAGVGPGLIAAKMPGKANYPTNIHGDTYGIAPTLSPDDYPDGRLPPLSPGDYPDLIAAIGEGGIEGYIRQSEADPFDPKSPEEALKMQEEYQAQGGFHYCNLYDKDGNVIGRFRVGKGEGEEAREAQTMPAMNDVPVPTKWLWPAPGVNTISAGYGDQQSNFHDGIDITSPKADGKSVVAAADGYVEGTGSSDTNGAYVVLSHGGGMMTAYEHLQEGSVTLRYGEKVYAGQPIAKIGSTGTTTGPHLHFEVLLNNETLDPLQFVKQP